jgi:8-oxo-dGTP pyrophosphatase MutT (NUDIX family)
MSTIYKNASYPPSGSWDLRLTEAVCPALTPVNVLHENPWFTVRQRGAYYTAEYLMPQVIVLPVVENHAFVMVRVKRPVLDDITLELPAGGAEVGEAPEVSATRELAEETGIKIHDPSRMKPMPPIAISPNRMPNLVYVFRVDLTGNEFEQRKPHDNEIESVELVPMSEAIELMTTGGIYVAGIIAIISMYLFAFRTAEFENKNYNL